MILGHWFLHKMAFFGCKMLLAKSMCVGFVLLFVGNQSVHAIRTTPDIEQIFIGRCWDYQRIVRPPWINHVETNCAVLWEKFSKGFMYKDPCNVTTDDFVDYAEMAMQTVEPNRLLFWENIYPFVNDYSDNGQQNRGVLTVVDLLLGYPVDALDWCGQVDPPGINYDDCPPTCPDGPTAYGAFWATTSTYFSNLALGQVYVMLNGSTAVAFIPDSYFGLFELVNLTPENNVTHMEIWVVHNIGGPYNESCGTGSVKDLADKAIAQGLTLTCLDDPDFTRHFQCVDNSDTNPCGFPELDNPAPTGSAAAITYPLLVAVLTVIGAGILASNLHP